LPDPQDSSLSGEIAGVRRNTDAPRLFGQISKIPHESQC
jgi:hypothetical protein